MQMESSEDLSLKLFVVLSRAMESITEQVQADVRRYGLNPTEFAVLELLYNKGDQPIQKIGDKILLASSSITYVVDKLEKKEYLKRRPCPKDRRVTYASITESGEELLRKIFPEHTKAIQEIFGGLNDEEKSHMIEQVKKLGLYAEKL